MRKSRTFVRFLGLSLALSFLFVGNSSAEKIKFNLDWVIYGRHTGYFTAVGKGFYKKAGLDVVVRRGFGSVKAVALTAQGTSDYGFGDMGALVLARGNDKVPVKALATIYQHPPYAVFFIAGKGINKPKDLAGKSITVSPGGSTSKLLSGFLNPIGINDKVIRKNVKPAAMHALLLAGSVDAITEYIFSSVLLNKHAKEKGQRVDHFLYSETGLTLYSNSLLTSEKRIKERPDEVRRFVKATLQGFHYAFSHPQEGADLLKKLQPQVDRESSIKEYVLVRQMMTTPNTLKNGMGYIAPEKVVQTVKSMEKYMALPAGLVKPAGVYTNKFNPRIKFPD